MDYRRMPIEIESPEEFGYGSIEYNLAESSVTDLVLDELNLSLSHLKLEYIPHRGKEELRKLIAEEAPGLSPADVLLTHGAAGALFIINTSLLSAGDHLVVLRPNYATNIEVPKATGCAISYLDLQIKNNWQINLNEIINLVQPNTKLISITTPHNPTGMVLQEEELNRLIAFAGEKKIFLLVDETYRDTCFLTPYPVAAAKSIWVISVSSLSKAFGLPGLRMGWIITRNSALMETFLAAKEMIHISNSALDEEVAFQFYRQKKKFADAINKRCMHQYHLLADWLEDEKRMHAVLPQGGVVCFPLIKPASSIDTHKFYQILLQKYKTMVGPGHWFEMPDTYMRIGFGWTDAATLSAGLHNISKALSDAET